MVFVSYLLFYIYFEVRSECMRIVVFILLFFVFLLLFMVYVFSQFFVFCVGVLIYGIFNWEFDIVK